MRETNDNQSERLTRNPGVSGMMRVRNDAEFIEASIISCIDALDELVIVYNDCTDESPAIISEMARRYPEKIKFYEYKLQIYAWNLSEEEKNDIINGTIPEENTLAGYYNYALSKTTCQYVMKIDADQIYKTEELKYLCDLYRSDNKNINLGINDIACLFITKILLSLSTRFNTYIPALYKIGTINRYHKALVKLIAKKKVTLSLSGINSIIIDSNVYVSLGKTVSSGHNILPPFNGSGDHLIFKVKSGVKYIPIIDDAYNKLNGSCLNVIEKFVCTDTIWFWGRPVWLHLNSCRMNVWEKTLENFRKCSSRYLEFEQFVNSNHKEIIKTVDENILSAKSKKLFCFVSSSLDKSSISSFYTISEIVRKYSSYTSKK